MILKKLISYFFIIFLLKISNLLSYELNILGNEKLSFQDIQTLTQIEINKNDLNINDINSIINDLYKSELIYDVSYKIEKNIVNLFIDESMLINEIYFNGNIQINDDLLLSLIKSKPKYLQNKGFIKNDIDTIRRLYMSEGYANSSIQVVTEKFNNKVNLIFQIEEGLPSKINQIKFDGNYFFSDRYLNDFISSQSKSIFDIFSSGSNFDKSIFNSDIERIKQLYFDHGFFDARIVYELKDNINNNYSLRFIINEKNRYQVRNIKTNITNDKLIAIFDKDINKLKKQIQKNKDFYDFEIFSEFNKKLNNSLIANNLTNSKFIFESIIEGQFIDIFFNLSEFEIELINQININGNSITKDKTLRSKLTIEPGMQFHEQLITENKELISKLKYINSVSFSSTKNPDSSIDLDININENKKTGNFLVGGSFSGDTGLGFGIGLRDDNLFGSGNSLASTIDLSSDRAFFKIDYLQDSQKNPFVKHRYRVFNSEDDLTSSYGYKVREYGVGYSILFDLNKNTSISNGFLISDTNNHSPINSSNVVSENITRSTKIKFSFNLNYDTTNDILYPTNGIRNYFSIDFLPESISDEPLYKIHLNSDVYIKRKKDDGFVFISNNIGHTDSLDGNLKTSNTFSLGGMNFKGFDYRGIGSFDGSIYLGGNNYFTSTIGYGDNFLFDEKDNINLKFFYTLGSIWGSDYKNNDDVDLRSSIGASIDILSVIPISLSYAVPIQKNSNDRIREFNFNIGTSF